MGTFSDFRLQIGDLSINLQSAIYNLKLVRHSSLGETRRVSRADVCVTFNAAAGRGRAAPRIESVRRQVGSRAEVLSTQAPAHGEEMGFRAAPTGVASRAAARREQPVSRG